MRAQIFVNAAGVHMALLTLVPSNSLPVPCMALTGIYPLIGLFPTAIIASDMQISYAQDPLEHPLKSVGPMGV